MVFNVTFNNMSVVSWRSVLLVEETGVPRENHHLVASHWKTYTSPWTGFELTILVVIGTDCSGICKCNYYMITTTMVNVYKRGYIGAGSGEPGRCPLISDGPINLSHSLFIIVFFSFLRVFSTQILNFERSLSLSLEPQSSFAPHCKISLRGPDDGPYILNWTYIKLL